MSQQHEQGIRPHAVVSTQEKGLGPGSAGQSGDTQGLSDVAEAGSESVEELLEEGQFFEAEIINAVEEGSGSEVKELHTKQLLMDDVPTEYLERD